MAQWPTNSLLLSLVIIVILLAVVVMLSSDKFHMEQSTISFFCFWLNTVTHISIDLVHLNSLALPHFVIVVEFFEAYFPSSCSRSIILSREGNHDMNCVVLWKSSKHGVYSIFKIGVICTTSESKWRKQVFCDVDIDRSRRRALDEKALIIPRYIKLNHQCILTNVRLEK